ncbi:MAG: hypothetical protein ABFE02_08685 [Sulfuricella sp.]
MRRDTIKIIAGFLMFLPSLGMAAEQSLGRLFFTPEQRARMDAARQQERSIRIDTEQQDNAPLDANMTLNGVVTRSDGKTTVWINNREQSGDKAVAGIAVPTRGKAAGQVSITMPDAKRSVRLKVGQSIDLNSGKVEESYRRTPPPPSSTSDQPPTSPAKPLPRGGDAQDVPEPADAQGAMPLPR